MRGAFGCSALAYRYGVASLHDLASPIITQLQQAVRRSSAVGRRTFLTTPPIAVAPVTQRASNFACSMDQDAAKHDVNLQDAYMAAAAKLIPALTDEHYKGDAGKVGTIGGCREYTGAPYFAAISALKVGADLSHVFCTEGAATVIKSYSPELIVHPYLLCASPDGLPGEIDEAAVESAYQAIAQWTSMMDVVVIGPGLGRDPCVHATVVRVMEELRIANKRVVIDADGLHIAKENLYLLEGWTNATLTPNKNEFNRIAAAVNVEVDSSKPAASLKKVVGALNGPTVVQKGIMDAVSDGTAMAVCTLEGSPRRAGGQGDVLSGTMAVFQCWAAANPSVADDAAASLGVSAPVLAAWAACAVVRTASRAAYRGKKRSMVAGDIIAALGATVACVEKESTDSRSVYHEYKRMHGLQHDTEDLG